MLDQIFNAFFDKYSINNTQITKYGIGNKILVQCWLLFPNYVFRCPCVLSVIEVILKLSTLFDRTNTIYIWQRLCHEDWCMKFKIITWTLHPSYTLGLGFYSHVKNTSMIISFYKSGYLSLCNTNPATLYWNACTKSGKETDNVFVC